MAGGSNGGSSNQTSAQFSNKIYKPQGAAFQQLWGMIPGEYNQISNANERQIPGVQNAINGINGSSIGAWNNQLNGGAFQGMNLQGQLGNSLANTLDGPTNTQRIYAQMMGGAGNNYADAMKNVYINDANKAAENMLSTLDARIGMDGMSGSSRHGVAQALGYRDINSNLQNNLARTGYDTFNQDLMNKLNIAQQADQSTLQRQQMMGDLISQQNQAMQGGLQNTGNMQDAAMGAFAPQQQNWSNIQAYQSALGGPIMEAKGNMTGFGSGNSSSWGKG